MVTESAKAPKVKGNWQVKDRARTGTCDYYVLQIGVLEVNSHRSLLGRDLFLPQGGQNCIKPGL